jgi:acyl carrier protein
MPDDLTGRVISVIAATQKIAPEKVAPESTFEELNIDSLDGINILFAIENEFNISVPDEEAKTIRSVREMIAGVEKLVSAKNGSEGVVAG